MKKRKIKTCSLFLRNISYEVKLHFHAWCIRRGKNMNREIENFMREKIKEK
jgi:hypothetical protein